MLLILYAAFVVVSLPLQQRVWSAIAADSGPALEPAALAFLALYALSIAMAPFAAFLAPDASQALAGAIARLLALRAGKIVVLATLAALVAPLIIAVAVLDLFPNSGDEYAYLFQAALFAKGRLWAAPPPLGDTFVAYRTWISDGKWVSQYPPGWPAMLAAALILHAPAWVTTPFVAAASTASLAVLVRRLAGLAAAAGCVAVYVATPFYLLNAASFYSHAFSALLIVLLCLACLRYQRAPGALPLLAVGALLGLIAITRYYSAFLLLPALAYWLFGENRRGRWRMIVLPGLAGVPFLALLMIYQDLITGSPFHSTYAVITEPDTTLSLAPWAVLRGLKLTPYRIAELSVWASPVLPLAYAACLAAKVKSRTLSFYDLIFPAFFIGFVFFPDFGGNRYGPRYWFEPFPLMLVTVATGAPQAIALARRWWDRPLALHAALGCFVFCLTALPFCFAAHRQQAQSREEPYRLAEARKLTNAIVVLASASPPGMAEDLARNPSLNAPVLYARSEFPHVADMRSHGSTIADLQAAFPNRAIWIYLRDFPRHPGRLIRCCSPNS